MRVYSKTHQGLVRTSNQDTLLLTPDAYGVADGMGGHKGGETASRVAAQVLKVALQGKEPEEQALKIGIEAANRRIYDMGMRDSELSGMGTTLTLLWEGKQKVWIAHVGDSRAYLYRNGQLTRQTEDHSMVAELIKNKAITPEAAANHPYRHVITRALGSEPVVLPDVFCVEKNPGDIWLACSDGLHNMLSDEEIAEVLAALEGEKAAEKLLEMALEHGGNDNISFVLGIVVEEDHE